MNSLSTKWVHAETIPMAYGTLILRWNETGQEYRLIRFHDGSLLDIGLVRYADGQWVRGVQHGIPNNWFCEETR